MGILPHKVLFNLVIGMSVVCKMGLILGLPLQPADARRPFDQSIDQSGILQQQLYIQSHSCC